MSIELFKWRKISTTSRSRDKCSPNEGILNLKFIFEFFFPNTLSRVIKFQSKPSNCFNDGKHQLNC